MKYGTSSPVGPHRFSASPATDSPRAYKLGIARLARLSQSEPMKTDASRAASIQPPALLTSNGMGRSALNANHRPATAVSDKMSATQSARRDVPRWTGG